MGDWAPKRFWKQAHVAQTPDGFAVHLDGRAIKTPAKAAFLVPTRAFAEAVAAEWDAQAEVVTPSTMPLTRLANSAIDTVSVNFAAVADMLADYGGCDLICYRAEGPPELVARQETAWDPLLDWAGFEMGAPLTPAAGVIHVAQPAGSLARMAEAVHALDPFRLAAFHDLVTISGSLVIALALIAGRLLPEDAWAAARIDEDWQAEHWGHDEEAADLAALRLRDFLSAHRAYLLLSEPEAAAG